MLPKYSKTKSKYLHFSSQVFAQVSSFVFKAEELNPGLMNSEPMFYQWATIPAKASLFSWLTPQNSQSRILVMKWVLRKPVAPSWVSGLHSFNYTLGFGSIKCRVPLAS